jgi:ferredoxin-NADP reductase
MAIAKSTLLVDRTDLAGRVSLLQLQIAPEDFAGFRGGRYIILNTGIPLDDGKTVKRAYSILDCDADSQRVTLGIKGLDDGTASTFRC